VKQSLPAGSATGATHLHLDPLGGVAGDMFIAAVLSAFPDLRSGMVAAIRAAGLPAAIGIDITPHRDHALTGLQFRIVETDSEKHSHRAFGDIRSMLLAAPLEESVRDHSLKMFTLLAETEAAVHGKDVETVSFHELGEWDSIADIVGAAYLISALDARWSVGTLPLGGGRVDTAHGPLAVPAPATARLLRGFTCCDDGIPGERVTPTGAVILRHLDAATERRLASARLLVDGTGFGTRTLPGISNALRVLAFAEEADAGLPPRGHDRIGEICFEVDDQTPEDLAIGLDCLRELDAVVDVVQLPALGKKGRMTTQVRVLAQPGQLAAVCDACFEQTTTLGVRYQVLSRATLVRSGGVVEVDGRPVAVKTARRPGRDTTKAEAADVALQAGGQAGRERLRQAVARALDGEESAE
jgi:uncharacterized protein (TIGR00299 family) protein